MLPMAAGLISGGLSLVSGLFGRSDDKKARAEAARVQAENLRRTEALNEQQSQRVERANEISAQLGRNFVSAPSVKMAEMVADAERFGFNPLTYLRSGAASLYSKVNDLPGFQMQQVQHIASPENFQASVLPQVRSLGGVFASAAQDGFGSYMSESRILQQQNFQRSMLSAALTGVQKGKKAGNSGAGSSFYVPGMTTAGATASAKGNAALSIPNPAGWERENSKVTNPWFQWKVDPTQTDASAKTNRYGESELAETLVFLDQSANDWWYNVTGKTRVERYNQWTLPMWGAARTFQRNQEAVGQLIEQQNKPVFGGAWAASPIPAF